MIPYCPAANRLFSAVALLWLAALYPAPCGEERPLPAVADVEEAIHRAANYMTRHCDHEGRFVYRRHVDPKVRYPDDKYNLLRHAGTMYSLTLYLNRRDAPDVRKTLHRAAGYLRRFIHPLHVKPSALAVWTKPEIRGPRKPYLPWVAKLGGAGLGLVALTHLRGIDQDAVPVEELRGLGRFLRLLQLPEGRFVSKYVYKEGPSDIFRSLYYPGEAMLGLALLHREDPGGPWLSIAGKGMAYLAKSRQDGEDIPADHWALLATTELLPLWDKLKPPPAPRSDILHHAKRITQLMIGQQKTADPGSNNYGSFRDRGAICPAAIRLEGLLAIAPFLPEKDRVRAMAACHRGVSFLLRTQIRKGPLEGGWPRAAAPMPDERQYQLWNRRVGEVRIDYVQHAMSALLLYLPFLDTSSNSEAGKHPDTSLPTEATRKSQQ